MVAAPMSAPWPPMAPSRPRSSRGCLGSRGGWSSRSSPAGSMPMAMAGRLSVSRLMNSRCTAWKGTGSPASEAHSTHRMPAVLPESRNWMAFLMFA